MEPRAKTLIERCGFSDYDRKLPSHDEMQIWVYKNFNALVKKCFPDFDVHDKLQVELEHAISDGKFVIGFIDAFCTQLSIGVEIKTTMPTLGELIRQIHFYSKYKSISKWIVVSPDDRYASLLRDNGITFYKYQGNPASAFTLPLFE
jgi:hypothetical protein